MILVEGIPSAVVSISHKLVEITGNFIVLIVFIGSYSQTADLENPSTGQRHLG